MEESLNSKDVTESDQEEFYQCIISNLLGQKDDATDECDEVISSQIEGDALAPSASHHDRSRTDYTDSNKAGWRNVGEVGVDNSLQTCRLIVCKSSEEIELLNTITLCQVLEASKLSGSQLHPQTAFEYHTLESFPSPYTFMSGVCTTAESFQFTPYVHTRDTCTAVPFHATESRSVNLQKPFVDSMSEDYSDFMESGTTTCSFMSQQQNVLDCSELESFHHMESGITSGVVPHHQTVVGCSNLHSSPFVYDCNTAEVSDMIGLATADSLPHAQNFEQCTRFESPQPMVAATTFDQEFQSHTQDVLFPQDYFRLHCMETGVTGVAQDQTGDYCTQYGTLPLGAHSQTYVDDSAVVTLTDVATTSKCDSEDPERAISLRESPIFGPHRTYMFDHEAHGFPHILEDARACHFQIAETTYEVESLVVDCRTEKEPLEALNHIEQPSSLLLPALNGLSCDMKRLSATLTECREDELRHRKLYHLHEDILTGASPQETMEEVTEGDLFECFQQLDMTLTSLTDNDDVTARDENGATGADDTCSEHSTAASQKGMKGSRIIHSAESLEILRTWWENHRCNPYPNDREVYEMIRRTRLTHQQIYDWFKNERSRKWKNDPKKKKQNRLPHTATQILRRWAQDHLSHPHPTKQQREQLAVDAGVTYGQVSHWFMNFRKRCKAEITKAKQQPCLDC